MTDSLKASEIGTGQRIEQRLRLLYMYDTTGVRVSNLEAMASGVL
jgi:hypothetical protein